MPSRLTVAVAIVLSLAPALVAEAPAQELSLPIAMAFPATLTNTSVELPPAPSYTAAHETPLPGLRLPREFSQPRLSTAVLTSLYVSSATLQALDTYSTLVALRNGAGEANPIMASLTKNTAAFIAVKAGVAASTIFAARHLAKRNKALAIITLAAINVGYAIVVSRNLNALGALRRGGPQ